MAVCLPDFAIASKTVRPTPPVPPATATTTIMWPRKGISYGFTRRIFL